MNWIFIGMLAGSLVTSSHDNKEQCEGRAVTLKEKGVTGRCVEQFQSFGTTGTIMLCSNNVCSTK